MKIPKSYAGIDGKKAYERIVNEVKIKSKQTSISSKQINTLQILKHDKYEYFFAGSNEFNLYKNFVETNFFKKQKTGLQTLEELVKPKLENDLFKGSSSIINSAMNMALRTKGVQVVNQAQLEYIFQNNLLDLSNNYSDTGLCLRTDSGANEKQAKDLIDQLGNNQNLPIYLPVTSYDLVKSGNQIKFKIIDKDKIISLPSLNSPNQSKFNNSDMDLKTGFPKQLNKNGDRTFWTRQDGLSRCFLDWYSILSSNVSDLSYSNYDGRVVLVKPRSG